MDSRQTDYRRLQLLTAVTAAGLIGIIALQFFWLKASYEEQRTRFNADIESAMTYALLRERMTAAVADQSADQDQVSPRTEDSLVAILGSLLSLVSKERPTKSGKLVESVTLNITDSAKSRLEAMRRMLDQPAPPANSSSELIINLDSSDAQPAINLEVLRGSLEKELRKRGISTRAELALINARGDIVGATCEPGRFRDIPIKSALSGNWIMDGKLQFQTAFPDAYSYVLRKMTWLLSVTLLLIVISGTSFFWLIGIFFRQKRLADVKNDFLNNMTHELKTPISSVAVAIELVRNNERPITDDRKDEYLSIAQGELNRLNMLVEKVLKMAAFERSEILLSRENFMVTPWMREIACSIRPLLDVNGSSLAISVTPEDLVINADKTHLTNLVQNLLENANKYSRTEAPQIAVHIADEGASILLEVVDNGVGIPEMYAQRVFDKFFRVPTGDRHDIKGYGLGLSYVKSIAELHGGHVSVSSEPRIRTSFRIRLPKV